MSDSTQLALEVEKEKKLRDQSVSRNTIRIFSLLLYYG